MQREKMHFDVVIVGAGPAGLSAAIKLKQLANKNNHQLSICVIEKGAEIGAHILSGCVFNPKALDELIPDWQNLTQLKLTAVAKDELNFLTKNKSYQLPVPEHLKNNNHFILSLGQLCRWLAEYAMQLDIEIFPGFAASELLINAQNEVYGIATNDLGLDKTGQATERFQPGIELHAKQVLLAEGCRGSLSQYAINHYGLDKNSQVQTYAIGIKEIWKIKPTLHKKGLVQHSIGWPLNNSTYGGSFLYHVEDHKVYVGLVIGLNYQNPYLNPFKEMQRFKTHPAHRELFETGERIAYGARSLIEGGIQSLPKLSFPGGMLIGDSAGFLNVPKLKGTHMSMKSGMLAAEAIFLKIDKQKEISYQKLFEDSWLYQELYAARNIRPAFNYGLLAGVCYAGLENYILKGKAPWTLKHHGADHLSLKNKTQAKTIDYPKADNKIIFDLPSSVYLSNVFHEENQPCHLVLKNTKIPVEINLKLHDAPEQRYCPAGVYEIIYTENKPKLQINAQNCIHCKTCDIKDYEQNITWKTPEGGGGPNYEEM